jgi:2-haloacid dehalogenase
MPTPLPQALVFDVFGTVVDWRGSIAAEGARLAREWGLAAPIDWATFADAWRRRYRPSMERVARGELPWTTLDGLHRRSLEETLAEFGLAGLAEAQLAHLTTVWHRLAPWPDSVAGLARLRRRCIVATLSNGNVALLVHMARRAGLPWDCILSAELFRAYKPVPRVYRGAADLLGLTPDQVMLVAAHQDDLRAAQRVGLRAAFVPRPLEFGPQGAPDPTPDPAFDYVATDVLDLARQLGTESA